MEIKVKTEEGDKTLVIDEASLNELIKLLGDYIIANRPKLKPPQLGGK